MASNFLKIDDKQQWQALLTKTLFRTFFHNPEWEEFLEKNFSWLKFERYLWLAQGGQAKALLSLARVKIFGKEKLISHPFCEYGGPLPLNEKIDGRQFKEDLFSEFKTPLGINLHPYLLNYFNNFEAENLSAWRKTYFIKEPLMSSFRYDIRHAIKKAENQKFHFEECQSEKDLEEFYRLYIKTVKRHKNIPFPFPFFQFFSKNAKIFLLKSDKKIATGSVFLFNKPLIHYFITAADLSFRKEGVNHLLLWRAIEECLTGEYHIMDLGATREGSDLEVFKRGWRGEPHPIYEITTGGARSKFRRSGPRSVLGLLPPFLIKKLSPSLLKYKL